MRLRSCHHTSFKLLLLRLSYITCLFQTRFTLAVVESRKRPRYSPRSTLTGTTTTPTAPGSSLRRPTELSSSSMSYKTKYFYNRSSIYSNVNTCSSRAQLITREARKLEKVLHNASLNDKAITVPAPQLGPPNNLGRTN